jgi:hypothetical protein
MGVFVICDRGRALTRQQGFCPLVIAWKFHGLLLKKAL